MKRRRGTSIKYTQLQLVMEGLLHHQCRPITKTSYYSPHPTRCTSEFKCTVMKPPMLYYDITLQDSKPLYCVYFLTTLHINLIRFISISKHLVTCSLPPLAASQVVHACQCGTPHILCEIEINKQEVTYEYEEVPRHRERPRKELYDD
jgi:hypothetical protein